MMEKVQPSLYGAKWFVGVCIVLALGAALFWLSGSSRKKAVPSPIAASPAPIGVSPALAAQVDALIVAPSTIAPVTADKARAINAAIPFSKTSNPAAAPFRFSGTPFDEERATACLAAAQLYEAGDDEEGQRAVAQVVLNRLRHAAYPKTVCGVVFQGQERRTGCQFTFSCDGAMTRIPSAARWKKARDVATSMLHGAVFPAVGYATHYHTDWVVPYWSSSLEKAAAIKTHLFFRWKGGWGKPGAFSWRGALQEPRIVKLHNMSLAHATDDRSGFTAALGASASAEFEAAADAPSSLAPAARLSDSVRVIGHLPQGNAFIVQFAENVGPESYALIAKQLCSELQRCNLMAWSSAQKAPVGFPLASGTLSTMLFNYVQDGQGDSRGSFWNCKLTKPVPGSRCLGDPASKSVVGQEKSADPARGSKAVRTPPGTPIENLPSL